jgi:hypothetical protein
VCGQVFLSGNGVVSSGRVDGGIGGVRRRPRVRMGRLEAAVEEMAIVVKTHGDKITRAFQHAHVT